MQPNKATRIAIVKTELEAYSNSVYMMEVRSRVARRLEDKEGLKKITDELVKLERAKDFLTEELLALENEKEE